MRGSSPRMTRARSRRVGKGALLGLSAWAKSRARRAHASTISQAILPTLPLSIPTAAFVISFAPFQTTLSRSRGAFFAPGVCFAASLTPMMGWAERRESSGACEAPVGPALSGQARRLARRLASPYGGRPPPALHRGDFWLRCRASLPGICAGSVTANSSHPRRSARWRPPGPPGAAVMNRCRRTPLLAPHSGMPREHAPNERGWGWYSSDTYCSQQRSYHEVVSTRCSCNEQSCHRWLSWAKRNPCAARRERPGLISRNLIQVFTT
jgi:hypothetical protein